MLRSDARAAAGLLLVLCAASARSAPVDWSYTWGGSPFAVYANGGTRRGAVDLVLPGDAAHGPPVAPVTLRAFTSLVNGADRYDDAAYSLTFAVSDPDSGQSHTLTVHGLFDGTVTSDRVSLSNTFTGGSGVQAFDFLGSDYTVTFGFDGPPGPTRTWSGELTASVAVAADATPAAAPAAAAAPPPTAPEPGSLTLAVLALPAAGLLAWGLRVRSRLRAVGPRGA